MDSEYLQGNLEGNDIRVGSYVVLDNGPYKVLSVTHAKPGKHGHAKTILKAENLFNSKKKEDIVQSGNTLPEPIVVKEEYDVIDLTREGDLDVFNPKTNLSTLLNIEDEETKEGLTKLMMANRGNNKTVTLTVLKSMGKIKIVNYGISKKDN